MQNNKDRLDVDLEFLDKAKSPETVTNAASAYKVNWRNIAIIGGLIIAFIVWIASDNNSSSNRPRATTPNPPATYQAPATESAGAVTNGQFSCSNYDSKQADRMAPTNEFEITSEEEALKRRGDNLDTLKRQLDTSGVTEYSDQIDIDRYNAMISRYNNELNAINAAYAAHQSRIDVYNQQVQARNDYLVSHCRRRR